MPHKHIRKIDDKSTTDLPPTIVAKPLPVSKSASSNSIFTCDPTNQSSNRKNNKKRKRNKDDADDTPKAFQRLLAFQQGRKLPSGLDDGVKPTKKQKKAATAAARIVNSNQNPNAKPETNAASKNLHTKEASSKPGMPTIQPGEHMSDFAARVDAAIPIAGLINKTARGGKDPLGLKVARTKKERKMHRMYDEWRVQDAKIKEKRQEALELADEEEDDDDDEEGGLGVKWKVDMALAAAAANGSKKKKKGKRKNVLGEVDDGDDDPWAAVARARNETKPGLHDVVLAPPVFKKLPREVLKVRGAAVEVGDVPRVAGSLRRREDLGVERAGIMERYKALKAGR